MENFEGITIGYADDLQPFLSKSYLLATRYDIVITEESFFKLPQSSRIAWVETFCTKYNSNTERVLAVTNDYYLIRLLECNMEPEKFQIKLLDTNQIVTQFVDIPNNFTLKVGEYVFRAAVKSALKGK